jgi:hypothetical protein
MFLPLFPAVTMNITWRRNSLLLLAVLLGMVGWMASTTLAQEAVAAAAVESEVMQDVVCI